MILVAYEVFQYRKKSDGLATQQKYSWFGVLELNREPSALDIVCYMTCFVGLFTGTNFVLLHFLLKIRQTCSIEFYYFWLQKLSSKYINQTTVYFRSNLQIQNILWHDQNTISTNSTIFKKTSTKCCGCHPYPVDWNLLYWHEIFCAWKSVVRSSSCKVGQQNQCSLSVWHDNSYKNDKYLDLYNFGAGQKPNIGFIALSGHFRSYIHCYLLMAKKHCFTKELDKNN